MTSAAGTAALKAVATEGPVPARFTREHARILALSTLGGALEFYEFIVFIYLTPVLSAVFFSRDAGPWLVQLQTLGIFAIGYLVRPFGGTVLAALGDRYGRKRLFGFTLLLMALGTLGIGLLPTHAQIGVAAPLLLLLCRVGQGLAMGGEFPAAATFVMETVPEKRVGFSISMLGMGFALGSLLAALMILLLSTVLSEGDFLQWGWRIPFLAGGLLGLLSVWLRRTVRESPVFEEMVNQRKNAMRLPFRQLFSKYPREVVLATLLALVSAALIQSVQIYPISHFQVVLGYPRAVVSAAQIWLLTGQMFMVPIAGWLLDRWGWNKTICSFAAANCLVILAFYQRVSPETLGAWWFLIGALNGGVIVPVLTPLARVFPASLRMTGIAASYNLAQAAAGGTISLLLGTLAHFSAWSLSLFPMLLCVLAIVATPLAARRIQPIGVH